MGAMGIIWKLTGDMPSPPPIFFLDPPFFFAIIQKFFNGLSTCCMISKRLGQNCDIHKFCVVWLQIANPHPHWLSTTKLCSQRGPIQRFCPGAQWGLSPPLFRMSALRYSMLIFFSCLNWIFLVSWSGLVRLSLLFMKVWSDR